MTETPSFTLRPPRRSMGLKLLVVCALALLMTIPALFVFALLSERTQRAETVAREIGAVVGGPQTFLGPVLAVPYTLPPPSVAPGTPPVPGGSGVWIIFPEAGAATVATKYEVRGRSLFKVPVYDARITFDARFNLAGLPANGPAEATYDWTRAELLVGASDARGARSDILLTKGGRTTALAPAVHLSESALTETTAGGRRPPIVPGSGLRLFGAAAGDVASAGAAFPVRATLNFSGAQRAAVLPFAKSTTVEVSGDWPHPSFDGGFLPTSRRVGGDGFTARWSIPFIARGVPAEGFADTLARLGQADLGVSFVEPGNPYQSVGRSLKYALLFVGLVFLTFFVLESTTGRRVHPAQYVLVGLAQIIFYLLLLALAEHLGFDVGFLVAASATVALLSAYAAWAFESRRQGVRALVVFAILYGGIYVLMRLEDYALLVGAIASFLAVAAVMWFTRRIDWYGLTDAQPAPRTRPVDFGAS